MNDNTVLLRQIHPSFIQHDRVTSQSFRTTPKDEMRLSVYDGDQIRPQEAWNHYAGTLGFASAGVMGVTVTECLGVGLPARPDPELFPEHAVIDFTGFEKRQVETKAKQLKVQAEARGWLYRETADPDGRRRFPE